MKVAERVLAVFVAASLIAGCSGGSSSADDIEAATPTTAETATTAVDPTPIPTATSTPEPTPAPEPTPTPVELSDQDKIDAAIAAFDADPQPSDLIAWDHLDATITGTAVRLEVCTWNGETIYDQLKIVEYRVQSSDGEPDITFIDENNLAGNCLNTELINTALAATRTYDNYWAPVLADPTTFDPAIAATIATPGHAAANQQSAAGWAETGAFWKGDSADANLPESSLTPIAYRRFVFEDRLDIIEIAACRELGEDFGLYNAAGVLVDDFKGDDARGPHDIQRYQMTRSDGEWRIAGVSTLVWADCLTAEWVDGLNTTFADPALWRET